MKTTTAFFDKCLHPLRSIKLNHLSKSSVYFNYAKENISCDCPKCLCPAQDKQYSFVYVSEQHKYIYYDVPKSASTTIRIKLFGKNQSLPHYHSFNNPQNALDSYFKFTFVRNPWDRMVSNWKMFTKVPHRISQLRSMTAINLSEFRNFVDFAINHPNHHWQPQTIFLPDKLDYIGRLENMQEGLNHVSRHIPDFKSENTIFNQNALQTNYRKYYDDQLRNMIEIYSSEDIKKFKYEF